MFEGVSGSVYGRAEMFEGCAETFEGVGGMFEGVEKTVSAGEKRVFSIENGRIWRVLTLLNE